MKKKRQAAADPQVGPPVYSRTMEGARRLIEDQFPRHGDAAAAARALGIAAPLMSTLRSGAAGPLTMAWQKVYANPTAAGEFLDLTDLLTCVLPVIFAPVKAAGAESWSRFCQALVRAAERMGDESCP